MALVAFANVCSIFTLRVFKAVHTFVCGLIAYAVEALCVDFAPKNAATFFANVSLSALRIGYAFTASKVLANLPRITILCGLTLNTRLAFKMTHGSLVFTMVYGSTALYASSLVAVLCSRTADRAVTVGTGSFQT